MTKNRIVAKPVDRFSLHYRNELDSLSRPLDIWYVKDHMKDQHGRYVARIYDEAMAKFMLDKLNTKSSWSYAWKKSTKNF